MRRDPAKPVEITFALTLLIALPISGCASDRADPARADRTTAITSHHEAEVASDADNLAACFGRMVKTDEMAQEAARRADYNTALEIWRKSVRSGNKFSQGSLCIFHMSQSTPLRYRDYDEAFDICSSLAVQGFSSAQYVLARMYGAGVGVAESRRTALYWFNQAAEGGDATSQYITGLGYLAGDGLPNDFVLAYKWLNLAAGGGIKEAVAARDTAASLLTRSELSEAQKLTRSYAPRPAQAWDLADDCAAPARL